MPPRRGSCRGAIEPEGLINHIEKIPEELVQVVPDTQSNAANAPEQPAIPVPKAEVVNCTTIKQFQQLKPPTFQGTPPIPWSQNLDPWELRECSKSYLVPMNKRLSLPHLLLREPH